MRKISIPFWSDFNFKSEMDAVIVTLISIPFWSDFNCKSLKSKLFAMWMIMTSKAKYVIIEQDKWY